MAIPVERSRPLPGLTQAAKVHRVGGNTILHHNSTAHYEQATDSYVVRCLEDAYGHTNTTSYPAGSVIRVELADISSFSEAATV